MLGNHKQLSLIPSVIWKNEMQAIAALPTVAGGNYGKTAVGLHTIDNHFQMYKG